MALPRLHLKRLHLVNERVIGLTDSWVPEDLVPGLRGRSLDCGSLWRTLRESYGLNPADAALFVIWSGCPGAWAAEPQRGPNGQAPFHSRTAMFQGEKAFFTPASAVRRSGWWRSSTVPMVLSSIQRSPAFE